MKRILFLWTCIVGLLLTSCQGTTDSENYDLVVYGATSAGVIAAYTAKTMGKSVLLVEPSQHLGGLTTGGLGYTDIGNKYAVDPSQAERAVSGKMFIDATYEGDLMARAGVSYTIGREANEQYGETYNGVQLMTGHQFPDGVDPYKTPGDPSSGLLWGISEENLEPDGTGDDKIQAYNYRICLTNDPANRDESRVSGSRLRKATGNH